MSQASQPIIAPAFTSIRLRSPDELPTISMEGLQKLNSPLVLVTIDDFKIQDLLKNSEELRRLEVNKVGFSAKRDQLANQVHDLAHDLIIPVELPVEELCEFLDWTQDEAIERMPFNAPGVLDSLKDSVRQHARVGETLVLVQNSEKIATCVGFDMVIDGEPTTLISWVWVKSDISAALKQAILSNITKWLEKTAQQKLFAAIHVENERSINFFSKMGFQPSCLFVRP